MENKIYKIKYFDGNSSKSHDATLKLKENHWLIEYEKDIPYSEEEITRHKYIFVENWIKQNITEENIENEQEILKNIEIPKMPRKFEFVEVIWELPHIQKKEIVSYTNAFHYGTFPHANLECDDANLLNDIKKLYPQFKIVNTKVSFLFTGSKKAILALSFSIIGLLLAFYFWLLPFLAESSVNLVPIEYEKGLGESVFHNAIQGEKENKEMSILVNEFAKNINFDTRYSIDVTVIESSTINAFAAPGGKIVVYTGLIEKMKNYEELAALLGHEVAHVHNRHSLKALANSLAGYIFLSAILSDVSGITTTITQNAHLLTSMHYSRNAEREADEKGAEVLIKNQISLQGMVDLFKRLEEAHESNKHLEAATNFMSSHPQTDERKTKANQKLKLQNKSLPETSQKENLKRIWKQIKN